MPTVSLSKPSHNGRPLHPAGAAPSCPPASPPELELEGRLDPELEPEAGPSPPTPGEPLPVEPPPWPVPDALDPLDDFRAPEPTLHVTPTDKSAATTATRRNDEGQPNVMATRIICRRIVRLEVHSA